MHTAEFTCHHIRQTKAGKTDFQEGAWSETPGPQANLTLEASTIQNSRTTLGHTNFQGAHYLHDNNTQPGYNQAFPILHII